MRDELIQIRVEATSNYISEQSAPAEGRYVFSYTVTIENRGNMPAKLLQRHWFITDANGHKEEVHGKGVIGQQPYLKPGEKFQYTSGTVLNTPAGAMEGYYEMKGEDGELFKADISPFGLHVPGSLH